jgi:REP element-mobilizing transposase RayT
MIPSRDRQGAGISTPDPLAYFLTWTCYGTWLHRDERNSVDWQHHIPGEPFLAPDATLREEEQERMTQPAYALDGPRRDVVLAALLQDAAFRGWPVHAAHVRPTHIHIVLTADASPERVLNDLKAYASRRLNEGGFDTKDRKRWTRHGSRRYLWTQESVDAAVDYVLHRQGEPLAVYPPPSPGPTRAGLRAATARERLSLFPLPGGRGSELDCPLPGGRGSENRGSEGPS